ncbi:MAG: DMT family transporter [Cardiobacterium sp.]
MPRFHTGHLALLLTATLFGIAFIFQRHSATAVSALTFMSWRLPLSALMLLAVLALRRRPVWGHWLCDGILCGILMFIGLYSQQWGLEHTTAGKSGFITSLYVILVPLLALLGGERLGKTLLLATLLAFAGLTCFAAIHSDSAALNWNAGDSTTLASAIIWALYVNYYGITVRRSDLLALTTVQISTAALLSLPLTLALEGAGALTDPALLNYSKWDILYTAIASSGIAFFLQGWGQRQVAATPAAIILSTESIFAFLSGWLILDEPVTPLMLTGCALLFTAMTVAQLEPPKP